MNNPARKKKRAANGSGESRLRSILALLIQFFCLFLVLSLFSALYRSNFSLTAALDLGSEADNLLGVLGAKASRFLLFCFGGSAFFLAVVPVFLHGAARGRIFLFILTQFSIASLFSVFWGFSGGGELGSAISYKLAQYVNEFGVVLITCACSALGFIWTTGVSLETLEKNTAKKIYALSMYLLEGLFEAVAKFYYFSTSVFLSICSFIKQGFLGTVALFISIFSFSWLPKREKSKVQKELKKTSVKKQKVKAVISSQVEVSNGLPVPSEVINYSKQNSIEVLRLQEDIPVETTPIKTIIPSNASKPLIKLDFTRQREAKRKIRSKEVKPKIPQGEYQLPSFDLLNSEPSKVESNDNEQELLANCKMLESALADFKIGGNVIEVQPGPVITLYQFQPAAGIKVQRIVSLADDLALALRVTSVRVYAPVPGKGTVGIEVPSKVRELVKLRDVLDTPVFTDADSQLTLALGKDTFGEPFSADLARMPHLLIAGATGTGKSVGINAFLISLLYKNRPSDLRLILIDPKMLELSVYEDIPHLKSPVITNPKKAKGVLWWAVQEMDRRYELMKKLGVRSLASYNAVVDGEDALEENVIALSDEQVVASGEADVGLTRESTADVTEASQKAAVVLERLPRIVIVVDELADLMLTVGKEIEELLTRLAQKARAAGIHLILATQRPSVNVITGLIKANFPSRVSFQVATKIDSRTVLDTSGADKLLGRGDMLFLAPGVGRLLRLHAPFISDSEVQKVVSFIKSQGRPDYDEEIERLTLSMEEKDSGDGGDFGGDEEYDSLYDKALQLVLDKGQASTSMIQRAFRIGYNRAARILECLEREGVVGPADGARPRKVLLGG